MPKSAFGSSANMRHNGGNSNDLPSIKCGLHFDRFPAFLTRKSRSRVYHARKLARPQTIGSYM